MKNLNKSGRPSAQKKHIKSRFTENNTEIQYLLLNTLVKLKSTPISLSGRINTKLAFAALGTQLHRAMTVKL